jgi:undecaprenyl-diphosphatase
VLFRSILVSAVSGYISVAFLLKFVQKHSISPFVWYRVIAGGVIIAAIMSGFTG